MPTQDSWIYQVSIPSEIAAGNREVLFIVENMRRLGWAQDEVFGIHMALEEAIINAIKHGNRLDPEKKVHIRVTATGQDFFLKVTDEGAGFDPSDVPDPTQLENLEMGSGRGLLLMNHYMDEVVFNERGNQVEIRKAKTSSP